MDGFDLFQAIGGTAMCRELSTAFYARVANDPVLRPLFPGKTFKCAIEEFSAFLVQLLGGPPEDTQRRWWLSLRESHLRFKIGGRERDAWIQTMKKALSDVQIPEPGRHALLAFFEKSSAYLVNTGSAPHGVVNTEEPSQECVHQQLTRRWDVQAALDQIVAAVRAGKVDRIRALAESPPLLAHLENNRSVFANLLGLMIGSDNDSLHAYARQHISADPALAQERYSGRTLLHQAASAGNLATVDLLLQLGADPNIRDAGGHTPLYWVANDCRVGDTAAVVQSLVEKGAGVDACDGVKHCTALHMAARRGNVEVAEALLDCGADSEARDSMGDTPLRRAVNCGKTEIVALLVSRGADRHSVGSKGLTPVLAARTGALSRLLQS